MGNCASTMRIIDSIELGLDGGVIKIESGKKKFEKSLARGDCTSGVFNRIFLSRYGVGNQVSSASLQDTTLDEIFTLRSRLDQAQPPTTSIANLLNNQRERDENTNLITPSPRLQSRRFADHDDINSSSFEALLLDLDEVNPYASLCVGRGPVPKDINDFEFSILPGGDYRSKSSSRRNLSPPSSHNSPRLVTRQNSEEPKYIAPGATPKFKSRLAIHKHDPINTSTGSSTSGVEISSLSSRSEIPNGGASLPRLNSSKLLYQPSYDPDDFLSPEDFENPLFIYRSLSFRRAIEEGNSSQQPRGCPQQHLPSFVGVPSSNSRQRGALRECQQDSSYFHASQDSGHAQSISLGSSLSIDGRFPAQLPSLPPQADETPPRGPPGPKGLSLCYRPSSSQDPFVVGSQDEAIDRFVWRSFTSEDSGYDPVQSLGADLLPDSSEDPFSRNHLAVELRVSPGRRRCLSTLTEEELTEAMSSGPHQPTHPFPFPTTAASSRGLNSHQPPTGDGLMRSTSETKRLPAPLAVTINTGRRTADTASSNEHDVNIPEKQRRAESHLHPSTVAKGTDATRPTSAAAAEPVARVSDTSQTKPVAAADEEAGAAEPMERTSLLIKAKRKSLHDMRHLRSIKTAEEPLTDGEEGQQTTKTTRTTETDNQRGAISNGKENNGCPPIPSSDKLHRVAEDPGAVDDPSDEPSPCPFPSLTDELLQQIAPKDGDDKTSSDNPEELSLQESEEKFACLALAFKTDRETLDKRIELHLRARDVAEQNIHKEMECLKDGIKVLNQSCSNNPSAPQTFAKIQTHFDVLEKSITRMSSRAEVHGAVQQELRVSQVIETMLEHVENLKRTYHTEHRELQEARQSLNDSKPDGTETPGSSKVVDRASFGPGKGCLRRVSLALMARQPKLLRNTSLQMSDSFNSSSPATAPPPPLHPSSLLFSNEFPENSSSSSPDAGIASAGSNQLPQQNRRYSVNQATRNGDTRTGAEDVRKRRFGTVRSGSLSKGSGGGGGGTSKEDGRFDVSPDQKPGSGFDQKTQTSSQYHRELLRRFLMWLVALLRLLLQRLLKVPFRDGLSFMLGAISKCHPLRVISPALIVILMFIVSAAALIVVIWTRWRGSQAIPTS